jgi:competence protein ComEC
MRSRQSTTPGGRKDAGFIPLFSAACFFALGIAATHWVWLPANMVLVAVCAVAVVCVVAAFAALHVAWLPMAVLWCLLGAWCAWMEPQPAPSPSMDALSNGLMRTVEGTVVDANPVRGEVEQNLNESEYGPSESTQTEQPSQRLDVELDRAEVVSDTEDREAPVAGRVRLTVRWPADATLAAFHCGEHLRAAVRLLPPQVYRDPGAWNRAEFLWGRGISATATAKIEQVESRQPPAQITWGCRLLNWQHGAAARLLQLPAATRTLPAALRIAPEDAAMLAAMVAGDRTYLTRAIRVGFERTGSFHMLVVAGFHLAIVSTCIFWLTRRLRLPRVLSIVLTIACSFAYALFTGFALPVARACWMVTLYLVGQLLYRERSTLNAVGFAALCLLAYSPRSLFDAGLQMTLLAVVSIAGVAVPLLQIKVHPSWRATKDLRLLELDAKLPPPVAQFRVVLRTFAEALQQATTGWIGWRVFPWCVRAALRVIEAVVVSAVVELAMSLPMAINFHRITLSALPVNIFILPLLFVLLPVALITLLLLAVWPTAAWLPAAATALVLHGSVLLVRSFGALRWGDVRIAMPALWQYAAFYALLGVAIVLARRAAAVQKKMLGWAAFAAMLAAAVAAVAPRPIDRPRAALLVEAIDVGQGDALLVITPDGKTLLIDSGGFGGGPHQAPQEFDIGEEVVAPALWARGIHHLDVVALSHAHSDHMGGMPAILRDFHPDEFWVGNNPPSSAYVALLQQAAQLRVRVRSFQAGNAFGFGATQVRVLAPLPWYRPGDEPANNDSLVLRVSYGATSTLLEGDAEAPVESAIAAEPGVVSTLLKVGHHGSKTSTHADFLAKVRPQWAVISCGLRNRYRHPAPQTLDALESARVRTARTDLLGATCFVLDGKQVKEDAGCAQ